jgi:hypothetical protein
VPWRVADSGALPSLPVIVFIPRSGDGCKATEAAEDDAEWLPRRCPACHRVAIIGHGRRRRPAHDGIHDWILVRRGLCKFCGGTLTVLPGWCVPGAPYSLLARQRALIGIGQEISLEQAAPHCRDPNRLPDGSTIRRWVWRRIESLRLWKSSPTLLAWDWRALSRILIAEPTSP